MIVILDGSPVQVPPGMLTEFEKKILNRKMSSPALYQYPSLNALVFELKLRSNIVNAARAMHQSGVNFATFENSHSNPQYWIRVPNGGFLLRPGVPPSAAVNDIFNEGQLYGFECATAIIIIMYKAVLDTIGEAAFNRHFRNLFLRDWQTDQDLQLETSYNLNETYPGDVLYFKNPDHDPSTPEWQGENAILLDDNLFFGHGIGIDSSQEIIAQLNRARVPGSMISAFLQNLVLRPDFAEVQSLTMRDGEATTARFRR
ncbi:protein-glutamine gamma-glutamyltransferase [Paenibacillus sp. GCM10027627]|uniref:protein-glutamine gamma-glutamyltransferase n=1 Tax=unclassified Paenibacillus TaxID=185978 RepID=UPI00363C5BAE